MGAGHVGGGSRRAAGRRPVHPLPVLRIAQRMRYELGDDALEIHGAARPISLPYATITDARLEHLEGAPIKSAGVGLPGFYWGSFTWRQAGPNLKLHRTAPLPHRPRLEREEYLWDLARGPGSVPGRAPEANSRE